MPGPHTLDDPEKGEMQQVVSPAMSAVLTDVEFKTNLPRLDLQSKDLTELPIVEGIKPNPPRLPKPLLPKARLRIRLALWFNTYRCAHSFRPALSSGIV